MGPFMLASAPMTDAACRPFAPLAFVTRSTVRTARTVVRSTGVSTRLRAGAIGDELGLPTISADVIRSPASPGRAVFCYGKYIR
jgi:hypothetical protein